MLDVAKIHDITFDSEAFSSLVLSQEKKDLMYSLIESQNNGRAEFDDFIKGKGKGLVFLLHGPPGVGKTLTAGK